MRKSYGVNIRILLLAMEWLIFEVKAISATTWLYSGGYYYKCIVEHTIKSMDMSDSIFILLSLSSDATYSANYRHQHVLYLSDFY